MSARSLSGAGAAAVVKYTALDIHKPFHASTAKYKCAVGGIGSGKSTAMYAECIAFALEQPGSNMLLCRKYGPDIKDTIEKDFFELLPTAIRNAGDVKRGGGRVQDFTFPNGSHVAFRGLDDWTRHKSTTYCWIGIDEADEQPEVNLDGISGRLRQTEPLQLALDRGYEPRLPMRRQICLASNPAGKNWLWRRFINEDTRGRGCEGFVSTTLDNPFLTKDYVDDLLSKDPAWVRRWVLCMFDELGGAIYPQWSDETHVVHWAPEEGEQYAIWHSFDPGTSRVNPSSCQWAVLDKAKARLVVIAEYEDHDQPASVHALRWAAIERNLPGRVVHRTADPAAIGARDRGSNMTLMDIYRRLGFSFTPAGSNRHEVRVPALGELIATLQFVVTADCPLTAEQIKVYSREAQLPQHVDLGPYREKVKKGNDGMVDCAQYLAMRHILRGGPAQFEVELTPEQAYSRQIVQAIRSGMKPRAHSAGIIA